MTALLLILLACSSEPEPTPVTAAPMALPLDNVRAAGEVVTSTYVLFAPGPQDHLVPLACFDTASLNFGRGGTCMDYMGPEPELQLEDRRMVKLQKAGSLECPSTGAITSAMKSSSPLGSGVAFGIWPSLEAAKWTPRSEDSPKPEQNRPLLEAAQRKLIEDGLSKANAQRVELLASLTIDLEGDGREDTVVEALVRDPASGEVTHSALFVGGMRPMLLTAPNLELFGHTQVLGATQTTSEGATLLLLESRSATELGWSVVQRTDQGFVARGSWTCDNPA